MTDGELLAKARQALEGFPGLELALLFGSVARGRGTERSDVDVAIMGDVDPLDLAARLSRATEREVDVVDITRASIPLLNAIVRDGVIVFERERGAGALFRSRALTTLETDRPWYERMQEAWLKRVAERGVGG